ncbi:MAG: ABC transporter substrate-binding protein [Sneathiellaceae bacterium]
MGIWFGRSVAAASVLLAATVPGAASYAAEESVKAGAILSIEGIFSSLGGPERDGIMLAVEQLNAAGGVAGKQIDLIVYDDGGDQARAAQLANRLIFQDQVPVSFGPSITPTAEMIAPIFEQNDVVMIGFVAQDYTWEGTNHIFMSLPSDAINAEAMVRHAAEANGAKKIAVAYANVPYGVNGRKFIEESAKRHGIEIATAERWGESDLDFTSQAGRVRAASPEAILIWGSCAAADAQMIKALREAGENAPIIGNLCIPSPQTAEIAGAAAEGTVAFSVLNYAKPDAEAKAFLEAFQARFGGMPIPFAATAYDGVGLWAAAVEKAGGKTDPASVAEAMIGLQYKGVSGTYHITEDNHHGMTADAYKPIMLQNGQWTSM